MTAHDSVSDLLVKRLRSHIADGSLPEHVEIQLPVALAPSRLVPPTFTIVATSRSDNRTSLLAEGPRASVLIDSGRVSSRVEIAGADQRGVDEIWAHVREQWARPVTGIGVTDERVWYHGPGGPSSFRTRVASESWQSLRRNYPAGTRAVLDPLMVLEPDLLDGRLLLWHGPPGTGKTTAVTALASSLSSWLDVHVVSDPEVLFSNPSYLMHVASSNRATEPGQRLRSIDEVLTARWKLIICEDADEYLRVDARARTGPALGRLLNLTDGILGRDSRAIVLLTTNDDVTRLHPALTRPGRCHAVVEFPPMSAREAADWLPADVEGPEGPATIAELFALSTRGRRVEAADDRLGLYL